MQSKQIDNNYITNFNNMSEFYKYLCDTPFNDAFRWEQHMSVISDYSFTQTYSFDEAVNLMKNGWKDMSKRLNDKLTVNCKSMGMVQKRKVVNSVAGYQPIVPLYLADVPENMVNTIKVAMKQKVINITKLICYGSGISTNTIIEQSIKALTLVKKLESMGYQINLYVALGTSSGGRNIMTRVKVKSAGERLNVSKLAFPLVHPSMLRRLMFRYIEVCPYTTKSFVHDYGYPITKEDITPMLPKNEIVIPSIWKDDINTINTLDGIKGI